MPQDSAHIKDALIDFTAGSVGKNYFLELGIFL